MVKPSKIKVSKILARISKKPKNQAVVQVQTRPLHAVNTPSTGATTGNSNSALTEYVAFMSADMAASVDIGNTPTISVIYNSPWQVKDNHLSMPFEVGDFDAEMFDRLTDFIDSNASSPKFAIHCTYGSQRSRAVAHFVAAFLEQRHQRSVPVIRMKPSENLRDHNPRLGDYVSYERMMHTAIAKGLM